MSARHMQRLSLDDLYAKAWEHKRLIEIDEEQNVAVLKIGREVWYASLPPAGEAAPDGAA